MIESAIWHIVDRVRRLSKRVDDFSYLVAHNQEWDDRKCLGSSYVDENMYLWQVFPVLRWGCPNKKWVLCSNLTSYKHTKLTLKKTSYMQVSLEDSWFWQVRNKLPKVLQVGLDDWRFFRQLMDQWWFVIRWHVSGWRMERKEGSWTS